MIHHRILVILTCVAIACAGCDRAWEAYQQIELGKPIPADNLLLTDGLAEGHLHTWTQQDHSPFPVAASRLYVAASVDQVGNVTAKTYTKQAGGHWGLLQSAGSREVMEIEVPESTYHNPPVEGLGDRWSGWTTTVSSTGHIAADEDDAAEVAAATNVLGYLILARDRLSHHMMTGPVPFREQPDLGTALLGALTLYASARYCEYARLPQYASELSEVTQGGFDWTYRNLHGYELRIQNLGGRRFRLEETYSRLFDAFMLTAQLDPPPPEEPEDWPIDAPMAPGPPESPDEDGYGDP
ncbi:MAG: hypothetical protein ACYTFO_02485 [Planctomycetota bacterium]|jgi:hypothetical protein